MVTGQFIYTGWSGEASQRHWGGDWKEGAGASQKGVPSRALGTLPHILDHTLIPLCTSFRCPALLWHPTTPSAPNTPCCLLLPWLHKCCFLCLIWPLLVHLPNSHKIQAKGPWRQRSCTPRTQGCACWHTAKTQETGPHLFKLPLYTTSTDVITRLYFCTPSSPIWLWLCEGTSECSIEHSVWFIVVGA